MSTKMKSTNQENKNLIDFPVHENKREQDVHPDDQMISALVSSVRVKVPDSVEERINKVMADSSNGNHNYTRRPYRWLKLSMTAAAAAMILIVTTTVFRPDSEPKIAEKPAIAEIKTEIELSDKNIKILWVHKKDFKLRP